MIEVYLVKVSFWGVTISLYRILDNFHEIE